MNIKLFVSSVFLLVSSLAFAQKSVNYEMKTKSFTVGISVQGDFLTKNIPSGFFFDMGYDFRKLYEDHSIFIGIGPRLKAGWLSGDNDGVHVLDWLNVSFNSLAYGASLAPSIGYELLDDPHIGLFLEGEAGIINYSTTAKLSDRYIELFGGSKKYNSTMNLYTAVRLGLRFNIGSRKEAGFWIGFNNQNSDKMLEGLNIYEPRLKDKKIYSEFGFNLGF